MCGDCIETTRVSRIKLDDAKSKHHAIIKNEKKVLHHKLRVDGCLIKNSTAADWALEKPGTGHVIVELKGTDVGHAAKQISATANYLRESHKAKKIAGLVVCKQVPKFDLHFQKIAQKFFRDFRGPIHRISHTDEFVFEHLLSANGPKRA